MGRLWWILAYAILCALEFVVTWAKEHVAAKIKAPVPEQPPAEPPG
jgi:hypothetical protein